MKLSVVYHLFATFIFTEHYFISDIWPRDVAVWKPQDKNSLNPDEAMNVLKVVDQK